MGVRTILTGVSVSLCALTTANASDMKGAASWICHSWPLLITGDRNGQTWNHGQCAIGIVRIGTNCKLNR